MGQKLVMSVELMLVLIFGSVLYTYFYPWLYNKVNHITKRGQDLHDKIDLMNTMIMLGALYVVMILLGGVLMGGFMIGVKKYKK